MKTTDDKTRVILEGAESDDYINASFVEVRKKNICGTRKISAKNSNREISQTKKNFSPHSFARQLVLKGSVDRSSLP